MFLRVTRIVGRSILFILGLGNSHRMAWVLQQSKPSHSWASVRSSVFFLDSVEQGKQWQGRWTRTGGRQECWLSQLAAVLEVFEGRLERVGHCAGPSSGCICTGRHCVYCEVQAILLGIVALKMWMWTHFLVLDLGLQLCSHVSFCSATAVSLLAQSRLCTLIRPQLRVLARPVSHWVNHFFDIVTGYWLERRTSGLYSHHEKTQKSLVKPCLWWLVTRASA